MSVVFGALAALAAVGLFGPVAGLVTAWLLLSPDAVASTARGGGAGATAAAATAATDYLRNEWRQGSPARQRRRTARRDRWWAAGGWRRNLLSIEHGLVIAWRATRSAWVAAGRAASVIPAGFRAGAQAARDHRTGHTTHDPGGQDGTPGPLDPGSRQDQDQLDGPAPAPVVAGAQIPGAFVPAGPGAAPSDSGGHPATGQAPPRPGDDMPTVTDPNRAAGSGELMTTADLRAEAEQIAAVIEQATILAGLLKNWQQGLPDAYASGHAAGGPRTKALDEAVSAVSEAAEDAGALAEALNLIRRACDQADALGDQANAMGAEGHTQGYVPA